LGIIKTIIESELDAMVNLMLDNCFEEGIWWVYGTGEICAAQERLAMVEG